MIKDCKPYVWNKKGNQVIDSGFKEFDRQTNIITYGNVIANTQTSSHIRPWGETNNYGYIMEPGEGTKFDMIHFPNLHDKKMLDIIYDVNRRQSVILYKFFITDKYVGQDVIGYVLTDYDHHHIAHCYVYPYGHSAAKRIAAIHECMNYICEGWWSAHKEAS